MGAWGTGNFENDDALDFLGELKGQQDAEPLERLFGPLVATSSKGDQIEASEASQALAAAELVAAARGWPSKDLPNDTAKYIKAIAPPGEDLVGKAAEAVSCVLLSSELLELWEDSDETETWNIVISSLIDRLVAPPRKLRASKQPKNPLLAVICSFCSKQIRQNDLVELTVKRPEVPDTIERGIFAHAECLNAKLHPRHILQWWRVPEL